MGVHIQEVANTLLRLTPFGWTKPSNGAVQANGKTVKVNGHAVKVNGSVVAQVCQSSHRARHAIDDAGCLVW